MMRLRLGWPIIFLVALVLGSKSVASSSNEQATKSSKVIVRQSRLAGSLRTWNRLIAEHGDNYRYEVAHGFYLGFGSITTVTVRKGRVIARTYEEGQTNKKGELIVDEQYSWTEKGAEVGIHGGFGAAPRTVDELYRECRDDVLTRNLHANHIYLEFYNGGVLSSCLYAPKDEVVDAAPGVSINALEFLTDKND